MKTKKEKSSLEINLDCLDSKTIYQATNGVLLDFMNQLDKLEKR